MASKWFILLLCGGFLCTAILPAAAQPLRGPYCRVVSPGVVVKLSQYRQYDGSYAYLADFVRDVNGTPCGVECDAPSPWVWASGPTYDCTGGY